MLEGLLGRTVGKFVTGLVVGEDASSIDLGTALKRNLIRVADGLFFYLVAAIALWASPTNQRFEDRWAHTILVRWSTQPAMAALPAPPRPDAWG